MKTNHGGFLLLIEPHCGPKLLLGCLTINSWDSIADGSFQRAANFVALKPRVIICRLRAVREFCQVPALGTVNFLSLIWDLLSYLVKYLTVTPIGTQ